MENKYRTVEEVLVEELGETDEWDELNAIECKMMLEECFTDYQNKILEQSKGWESSKTWESIQRVLEELRIQIPTVERFCERNSLAF